MFNQILQLVECGFSPLPVAIGEKKPCISKWPESRLTHKELLIWKDHIRWGILTGKRSGNIVAIDFDHKYGADFFDKWKNSLPESTQELLKKLVITKMCFFSTFL